MPIRSMVIRFSQVLGGRPRERFQSGIGETPCVAVLAMERAAEAETTVGTRKSGYLNCLSDILRTAPA